jgi:hypothetical protein
VQPHVPGERQQLRSGGLELRPEVLQAFSNVGWLMAIARSLCRSRLTGDSMFDPLKLISDSKFAGYEASLVDCGHFGGRPTATAMGEVASYSSLSKLSSVRY